MSLPAKTPHRTNTRRKPEAWHASVLRDEVNALLRAILRLHPLTQEGVWDE